MKKRKEWGTVIEKRRLKRHDNYLKGIVNTELGPGTKKRPLMEKIWNINKIGSVVNGNVKMLPS